MPHPRRPLAIGAGRSIFRSMPRAPASTADTIAAAARAAAAGRGLPPVHLWDPPFRGDIDMEIRRDGSWFYEGTPIARPALVRLFSTILKREGGRHVLVTPVEKVGIRVEDAPFVAVDFEVSGDPPEITFETNVGDRATAGPEHPIEVTVSGDGEPAPYVEIRNGLMARIDRKTFYRLVELGEVAAHEGADWFGVRSGGRFFPILPAADLPET